MKNHNVKCAICDCTKNYKILYSQNYQDSDLNKKVFSARRLPDNIHYQLVRCNDCGLVRSTPVAENAILNDLYKKSKLNYSGEIKNLTKTYIRVINPVLNKLNKKSSILEIGCGNGFLLEEIYKLGYSNVQGFEPSIDAVKNLSQHLSSRIINSYFRPNLIKSKKFNLIVVFQTLDHIPNPNQFLVECYKILKPNGYIFAFNHNVDSVSARLLGEKSPIFDIEHTFLYNPTTIKRIFEKNGFLVESVTKPWSTLSLKHLIWLFPFSKNIKKKLLKKNSPFYNIHFKIPLGNLAITAKK
ncbi:MAG: class I SAM-dependent methyltransferase [Candidatus Pacebacteria bacterium]|jgi:2-polyprenyl-3-methyl-5-hydroxy-6-metoxy-1,4-benzoquinol methylase|nr:class I SAM-dependent methyltransferase [Candidatus Paceibacterota bacterium]